MTGGPHRPATWAPDSCPAEAGTKGRCRCHGTVLTATGVIGHTQTYLLQQASSTPKGVRPGQRDRHGDTHREDLSHDLAFVG